MSKNKKIITYIQNGVFRLCFFDWLKLRLINGKYITWREGERERKRETEGQTDKERKRETDREREREEPKTFHIEIHSRWNVSKAISCLGSR
jgi:hypothetical protein